MTLADLIATDFATAQTDWDQTLAFQTVSMATGATGTETETLGTAVEVLGFWQPVRNQDLDQWQQRLSGIEGRPKWLVMVPLATSVAVGDVGSYFGESGEVMALDNQPGHTELILKERK